MEAAQVSALEEAHPELVPPIQALLKCRQLIEDAYADYVTHVSPPQMAISLETASYLLWLARHLRPARTADYGSGFTSYVLRCFRDSDVVSVDSEASWLRWSQQFSERWRVERLGAIWVTHNELPATPAEFGLVCYDYGSGQFREDNMPVALDSLGPNGICVFDDAQHYGHQMRMREECAKRRYELIDLSEFTKDQYGRFAALAIRGDWSV